MEREREKRAALSPSLSHTFNASACSDGVDSAFRASIASRSGWSDPSAGRASQKAQGRSSLAREEAGGGGTAAAPATEVEGRPYSEGESVVMVVVRKRYRRLCEGGRERAGGGRE